LHTQFSLIANLLASLQRSNLFHTGTSPALSHPFGDILMNALVQPAVGAALLRISLGVIFLAHGLLKVLVFTLPGTVAFFESLGLPGVLAYAVTAAELAGGAALILGWSTRWVALGLAAIGFGAILGHAGNGWVFSNAGGGWEYPLFLGVAALALALIGPGAWALDRK
jgi:putative oxidoreductase